MTSYEMRISDWSSAVCSSESLLVTGAVLIAVYAPRPERGAIGAVTLVSFAITAPWAVWCSRLLLLRMEAQAWRMPALPAAIPVALLHELLATVAVPATLLVDRKSTRLNSSH